MSVTVTDSVLSAVPKCTPGAQTLQVVVTELLFPIVARKPESTKLPYENLVTLADVKLKVEKILRGDKIPLNENKQATFATRVISGGKVQM